MVLKQDDHCLARPCGFITGLNNICIHNLPYTYPATGACGSDKALEENEHCLLVDTILGQFPHVTKQYLYIVTYAYM